MASDWPRWASWWRCARVWRSAGAGARRSPGTGTGGRRSAPARFRDAVPPGAVAVTSLCCGKRQVGGEAAVLVEVADEVLTAEVGEHDQRQGRVLVDVQREVGRVDDLDERPARVCGEPV